MKKTSKKEVSAMVFVGNTSEGTEKSLDYLLKILKETSCEEKTKREAIRALTAVSRAPEHTTITNCAFDNLG